MAAGDADALRSLWVDGPVDLVALFGLDASAWPQLFAMLGPDTSVTFRPLLPGADDPGYRGPAGLAAGWTDWLEPYDSYVIEIEDFVDAGDYVYMPVRVHARTRRDGVAVDHAPAAVCQMRDGRPARVAFYLDREEARAEAGLDG